MEKVMHFSCKSDPWWVRSRDQVQESLLRSLAFLNGAISLFGDNDAIPQSSSFSLAEILEFTGRIPMEMCYRPHSIPQQGGKETRRIRTIGEGQFGDFGGAYSYLILQR